MTYYFVCEKCGLVFFEEMTVQQYTATSIHACPECHSTKSKRFYNEIPWVIYKGNGFTKKVKED